MIRVSCHQNGREPIPLHLQPLASWELWAERSLLARVCLNTAEAEWKSRGGSLTQQTRTWPCLQTWKVPNVRHLFLELKVCPCNAKIKGTERRDWPPSSTQHFFSVCASPQGRLPESAISCSVAAVSSCTLSHAPLTSSRNLVK